jgi:hypothetical protein
MLTFRQEKFWLKASSNFNNFSFNSLAPVVKAASLARPAAMVSASSCKPCLLPHTVGLEVSRRVHVLRQGEALQKIINGFVMEKHYSQMRFFNEYY